MTEDDWMRAQMAQQAARCNEYMQAYERAIVNLRIARDECVALRKERDALVRFLQARVEPMLTQVEKLSTALRNTSAAALQYLLKCAYLEQKLGEQTTTTKEEN